ncbi:MAG: DNA pilot protein [Microviridae sp.]|nr:MAG: DNA pilot protein [Microviridae sp.]
MSIFSKIGKKLKKVVKKVLPFTPLLGLIPGVGGAISNAIGGLSSAKQADTDMGAPNAGPQPERVEITGDKPGVDWGKWAGVAAPIATGALNYYGQQQTNAANAQQAQQQMDFQAQQSSTSYQRGMEDMKKAGLNPILAYQQGGAGFGAGASAQMGNELGEGANSALSAAQTIAQLKNLTATNENIQATTGNIEADTDQKRSQIALNTLQGGGILARTGLDTQTTRNAQESLQGITLDNALKSGTLQSAISSAKSTATLKGMEIPYARNLSEAEGSWWKKNVAPYLHDAGSVLNSATSAVRLGR